MNDVDRGKLKEAIGYIDELMNAGEPEFEVEMALRNERFILEILTKYEKGEFVSEDYLHQMLKKKDEEIEQEKLKSLSRLEGWNKANKKMIKQKEEHEKSLLSKKELTEIIPAYMKVKGIDRIDIEELADFLSNQIKKVEGVEEKIEKTKDNLMYDFPQSFSNSQIIKYQTGVIKFAKAITKALTKP